MKNIETKLGTKLPLLSLKGKDYLQVVWRIVWFREEHPLGRFDTECIDKTDKYVIYKATVSIPVGSGEYIKLADGVKREDFAHFADAHEKAQTGAIGRALAMIGYGTAFAPELDEGDRIVDAPLPPQQAVMPQDPHFTPFEGFEPSQAALSDDYIIPFGTKYKGKRISECDPQELRSYCDFLMRSSQEKGQQPSASVMELINRVRSS